MGDVEEREWKGWMSNGKGREGVDGRCGGKGKEGMDG